MAKNDFKLGGGSNFKANPPKTNFGGNNNGVQNQLQMLMARELIKKQQMENAGASLPTNPLPGTKQNVGPSGTTTSTELNRVLTDDERATISGYRTLLPTITLIKERLNGNVFDDQDPGKGFGGDVERTLRQGITDIGSPMLSSKDTTLQGIQGDFNHLKSLLPFANGGKQLTGTEKDLVFKLLNTAGKSNEQIVIDLDRTIDFFKNKEALTVGGANAIPGLGNQSPVPGMNQDPNQADEDPKTKFLRRKGLLN
jgi:hypothetical protein